MFLIDTTLRCLNPYAQAFQSMREVEEQYLAEAAEECQRLGLSPEEARVPEVRLLFNLKEHVSKSYAVPVVSEVAAVFVCDGSGEQPDAHMVIHPRNGSVRTLSTLSPDLDPMCFSLLLPYGTRGWSPYMPYLRQTGARKYVSRREFVAFRLAVREGIFNPILFGGRLFQEFIVMQYVYVEADRMQWFVVLALTDLTFAF